MELFRFFLLGLIATANANAPKVMSTPPSATTQLNVNVTFNCDGGNENFDIIQRQWQVNGTEYRLLPNFQSHQWTSNFAQLTVNTSALAFPYCSMELTCQALYNSDLRTELSEPVYLRINESIARPQVKISHYNQETKCIEIQWEHPPQCTWADVLSNVSSPNSSMPSSVNNAGNYTACYEEFEANDVYVFQITPFNKFQVGQPAIISITISETPTTSDVTPSSSAPTYIPTGSRSTTTSSSSTTRTQASTTAEPNAQGDPNHVMLDVLAPVFAALIILIAVALLVVMVALFLRRRPQRREQQSHDSFFDVNASTNQITSSHKSPSTETIETCSKSDSNTSSTFRLVIQVVSSPGQPPVFHCQPASLYSQDADHLGQLAHNV